MHAQFQVMGRDSVCFLMGSTAMSVAVSTKVLRQDFLNFSVTCTIDAALLPAEYKPLDLSIKMITG
jgi:hypothetical protein